MNSIKAAIEKYNRTQWQKNSRKIVEGCLLIAIIAITMAVYWPSLWYAFQFDDIPNIEKYFAIRHAQLSGLFFSNTRWISYWLNARYYQIGGFCPWYYRLGNIIIHLVNGVLLFFITRSISKNMKTPSFAPHYASSIGLITTLCFLLHPVQTQTVSYVIQGQLEGLATLSLLLMTTLFLQSTYTSSKTKKTLYIALLLATAILACGTKEIAIIAPLLLLAVDWFFVAQRNYQQLRSRMLIHVLVTVIICSMYLYLLGTPFFIKLFTLNNIAKNNIGNVITSTHDQPITPYYYCISQAAVIIHYIWIFIWPLELSVEYDWKIASSITDPSVLFSFFCLALLAYILYKIRNMALGNIAQGTLCWFFIYILPRSSIIPSPELVVDYKTYGASCGLFILIAYILVYGYTIMQRRLSLLQTQLCQVIAGSFLLCCLSSATAKRNTVWSSGKNFWYDVMVHAPKKARGYNNYGVELANLEQYKAAIPYFQKAIELDQHYSDPLNNIAVSHFKTNNVDMAIHYLKKALAINDTYPEGYNNLASFYLEKGNLEQAEKMLHRAISLRPYYGKAYFNLGRIYLEKKEPEKAMAYFYKACFEGDLDNIIGFEAYAQVAVHVKQYDQAIKAYEKIVEKDHRHKNALLMLGKLYAISAQPELSDRYFTQMLTYWPHDHTACIAWGQALVGRKEYQKAIDILTHAQQHALKDPFYLCLLAECYTHTKDYTKAQEVLTMVASCTGDKELLHRANEQLNAIKGMIA